MKKSKLWLGIALSILALFLCASAPKKPETIALGDYGPVKEYLSAWIPQEMKKAKVVGLSIALVDDQEIIWAEGFGWADKKNKVPATVETVYRVGSISKLFTATAVMQLAEQNLVDIDQPLQTYLPEFSIKTRFPEAGPITPRTIITHHSGLPGDRFKGWVTPKPVSLQELVEEIKDEYVAFPPNLVMSYSNLGVGLLGRMVEKVSGQDFAAYAEDQVLRPLGMTHSSFRVRPEVQSLLSKGYIRGNEPVELIVIRDYPAGSLYSNVADLSRLIAMVFADGKSGDRQILQPETIAEMLRVQNGEVPLDLDWTMGLGWWRTELVGGMQPLAYAGRVAQHGGDIFSYHSMLVTLPDHKLGVVVLANSGAGELPGQVAVEALKMALLAKTGLKEPEPEKPSPVMALSPDDLHQHEGYYETGSGAGGGVGLMAVSVRRGRLHARLKGKSLESAEFIPHANGNYSLRPLLAEFIPIRIKMLEPFQFSFQEIAGYQTLIVHLGDQRLLFGEKLAPVPIPEAWQKREGRWEVVNPGEDTLVLPSLQIKEENDFLMAQIKGVFVKAKWKSIVALAPVSDTEAIFMGLGRGKGETIHVIIKNGEEQLQYSGFEFRRKP
ncbi:MAG: hypothetical protein A2V67_18205 [Deltaproteobacteria bacterium RBG_13_61_14]|nr:MAG: hypothetical protein A2V67_18205 [Deltaproteobacteria bacterium RBG_13_61_14]